jgi:hypothetical protein
VYEIVLLGAGASVESDVPSATDMTKRFLEMARRADAHPHWVVRNVLTFVIAELVARQIKLGGPYDAPSVNIEDVLRTVRGLRDREYSEYHPFVGSWTAELEHLDRAIMPPWDRDNLAVLLQDIQEQISENPVTTRDSLEFVYGLVQRFQTGQGHAFTHTYMWLMQNLVNLAYIDSVSRIQHYQSFVKAAHKQGVTIATLNYDNAVEFTAETLEVPVSNGLEGWYGKFALKFEPESLKLLKLHGSVTWGVDPVGGHDMPGNEWHERCPDVSKLREGSHFPAIIFGERNKLMPYGPMLQIFEAFRAELSMCSLLRVVGYSFRDEHVNELLWQWLQADGERRITVYDKVGKDIRANMPVTLDGHAEMGRITFVRGSAAKLMPTMLVS